MKCIFVAKAMALALAAQKHLHMYAAHLSKEPLLAEVMWEALEKILGVNPWRKSLVEIPGEILGEILGGKLDGQCRMEGEAANLAAAFPLINQCHISPFSSDEQI